MSEILDILLSGAFLAATLRIATPLIFGTLGELICERAGVLNLGIEGIMTAGAMSGWLFVHLGAPLWLGLLLAAAVGAAFGLLHGLLTVPLGLSQHVTAADMTVAGFATLPFGWSLPTASEAVILLMSAAVVAAGYQLYVLAIQSGDISFISPFRYVAIPLAMLLGFIGWGDVPGPAKLLGALVIVGSGLFIFYRERVVARRAVG